MKNKIAIIYIIAFLLIALVSVFTLHHTQKIESSMTSKNNVINTFITHAVFTKYNKLGMVKTTIEAKKVTHYQEQNTILFEEPRIISYGNDRNAWHIRADQGVSDSTGKKIILSGHVIAHQLQTAKNPDTIITTSELTLLPKKSEVTTDQPIILKRPGVTMSATGFSANLKTGEYQLHSETKVIYQPTKVKSN